MEESYDEKYVRYYELFNNSKDYSQECDFIASIFYKYGKDVKNVLDLGCGTGLHAAYLAQKGFDITGIDLSEEMIKKANSKNIQNSVFKVGNMTDFYLDKKFDSIITMFAAIGYVTENKDISSIMKNVREHLKKNGLFVIDCWNGLGVMNELPSSRTKEVEIGNIKIKRVSYPEVDSEKHLCDVKFNVNIEKGNEKIDNFEEKHLVRYFFPQELKKYLEDSGFEVLEICPSYRLGEKLDEKAWNMVLIARKL